jgi:hypothetical protein
VDPRMKKEKRAAKRRNQKRGINMGSAKHGRK